MTAKESPADRREPVIPLPPLFARLSWPDTLPPGGLVPHLVVDKRISGDRFREVPARWIRIQGDRWAVHRERSGEWVGYELEVDADAGHWWKVRRDWRLGVVRPAPHAQQVDGLMQAFPPDVPHEVAKQLVDAILASQEPPPPKAAGRSA